jgi:hypothetical protein
VNIVSTMPELPEPPVALLAAAIPMEVFGGSIIVGSDIEESLPTHTTGELADIIWSEQVDPAAIEATKTTEDDFFPLSGGETAAQLDPDTLDWIFDVLPGQEAIDG